MAKIFTPENQVRLTDVSIVRMKKGGMRFEIACYKNKVVQWRNRLITDLDNVLQIEIVFTNVSKGQVARKDDLLKVFGTDNQAEICKEILKKGELQVSDKERSVQLDLLFKETAHIVSDKCINPETQRPYTTSMIQKAMKDIHFSASLHKNAKQLALEVIPKLKLVMPLERAKMRVKVVSTARDAKKLKDRLLQTMPTELESEKWEGPKLDMVLLIEPGCYKQMEEEVHKSGALLELISFKAITEGDHLIGL